MILVYDIVYLFTKLPMFLCNLGQLCIFQCI